MRLLACVLLLLTACPSAPPPPSNQRPPSGSGTPPAVAEGGCASDADCVVSCARKDDCCDQLCAPCEQVFLRSELAALEAWRAESCKDKSCPMARCMPPKEQTSARCEAGRCTLVRSPVNAPDAP